MKIKNLILPIIFSLFFLKLSAQEDSLLIDPQLVIEEPAYKAYDPLSPARAAFYSAVLPGLGQAYNGKYWKIPIVYTALGVGVYFYLENDRQYDRYRSAYKSRLAGNTDDEFYDENGQQRVSTDALIEAQRFYQRNKEVSVMVTLGLYALNIIDANVDAHLQQFNVSEDLSLRPNLDYDQFTGTTGYGLTLNFNF
ncbi:DUF5683 domain-containing protein [Salinimicrobium sediminilitoris]|uniref:DUF5683 domain-containing protein n=1 Tax=Salinimicrobium sediminilitoris TaxID=2876715 RepID=UPI001E32D5CA|nr:DUF5683 domain-containing protein [Salinimicrobium sediminilitoris]